MAIAFVNKGTKAVTDPGTSLTASYTGAVAGNLLITFASVSRFSTTAGALTVPSGFTAAENPTSVGNQGSYSTNVFIGYKANIASGSHSAAYTSFPAGGSAAEAIIAEFSGLDTVAPLDTAHNHNASSTAGLSGTTGSSGTATQANVLWVAVAHAENGSNTSGFTASVAGWTTIANTTSNAAGTAWWCGYQIAAVNTAVNPGFSWTNSSIWAGAVAGFIPSGGGGGGRTLFYAASLDGLSSSGPKQFNPSLGYHRTPAISLEAYRREQALKHRAFMARVRSAA